MRTKRVALHRLTVCSRVAGGEERSRRVRLAGRPAKESVTSGKTCLLFKLKGRGQSRIRLPFYDRESFTEVPDETIGNLMIKVNHNGRIPVYLHSFKAQIGLNRGGGRGIRHAFFSALLFSCLLHLHGTTPYSYRHFTSLVFTDYTPLIICISL